MKRRYFMFGLSTMVLVGCNQRPSVSKFVGKWKYEGKGNIFLEFTEDGQVSLISGSTALSKKAWRFSGNDKLIIGDQTPKLFRFENDNTLIIDEPPQEMKYTKVK